MKRFLLGIFLFVISQNFVNAQCFPPVQPSVNDCHTAPVFCDDLLYHCGTLPFEQYVDVFPACPGNILNNAHFLRFVAGSTTISFEVTAFNCTFGNNGSMGMQAAIVEDCFNPNALAAECNPQFDNTFVLSSNQFVVGNTYLLVFDGFGGSVCDYEMILTNGTTFPILLDGIFPDEVVGPDDVENGETHTFATNIVFGASDYIWTVNGGNVISTDLNSAVVNVTDDSSFEVCVQAINDCSASEITCTPFEMSPEIEVIEATICEGECFQFNSTLFCNQGTYDVDVDNGNDIDQFRLIITVVPSLFTVLDTEICFGDCYIINGNDYCDTGTYEEYLVSSQGCDSIIILNLIVLDETEPQVNISSTGELDCDEPTTILSVTSSVPVVSYQWTGPDINASNENVSNPQVGLPGTYSVVVTIAAGCSATAFFEVTGNAGIPDITIEGNDPLNCNNLENTITASSTFMNIEYEWWGPGGFIENGPEVMINESGEYYLIVTTGDGCVDSLIVNVEEDNAPLLVDAGPNRHIQCEFVLTLNAPGAAGNNVAYEWSTNDGNILSGENTLNPVVNADGTYFLTAIRLDDGCTGTSSMVVYADMAIIENPNEEVDCITTSVVIDATDSYNGPDATFQWSTNNGEILLGGNTLTPTVTAGVYQLVITRPGCLSFATAVVVDNAIEPSIDINASSTVITCFETPVLELITDAVDPIVTWYRGQFVVSTSMTVNAGVPGTYTVEVTGANGCSATSSIEITEEVDPQGVAIFGDIQLDCTLNGVGGLQASAFGNEPFYQYSWFTNDGEFLTPPSGEAVTILGPGEYCVIAINVNTGCSVSECVLVTEISNIEIDADVTDASCPNANDGSIEITVSGGFPPYIYEWSTVPVQPNQNIYNLSPGVYNLVITDSQGCQAFQTFIIDAAGTEDVTADAGPDQSLDCLSNFLVLDGGGSVFPPNTTFQWTSNDGVITEGATTLFPTVTSTGTYVLTIFSPEGCEDSDAVVVSDYEADAGPSLTLDCATNEVILEGGNAQSGASYEWTTDDGNIVDGAMTLAPTVNAAGTYDLVVTLVSGCTYTASTDVQEDFAEPDVQVVDTEVMLVSCNEPALLEAESSTNGATYFWEGPGGNSNSMNFEVDVPGVYTLTVTGENGCTNTVSAEVIDARVYPVITPVGGSTQYLNCFNGNPLAIEAAIGASSSNLTLDWTTLDGNIVLEDANFIKVDIGGTYTLNVIDESNGCESAGSVLVEEEDAVIDLQTTIASCGIADATATVETDFIHNPEFMWSTGETGAMIGSLAPGDYQVTVSSPESTCDEILNFEIIQDPSCFVVISGYLFDDENLNCDPNDVTPKADVVVSIMPEDASTVTDQNGYYEFLVPPGEYTITPELVSPFVVECPASSIMVSVPPGSSGSENNDFFIKALSGFDLYTTAGSGSANAGSNQNYQISFCNNWFTTIFGTVEFTHDPLLEFDPVAAGADSYDPATNTAVWSFEDLSFFECEFISFQMFIPESIPDGTTLSSSVTVLPTQGDIAPNNNAVAWTKTVNNSGNTSMIGQQNPIDTNNDLLDNDNVITNVRQYPNPVTDVAFIEFELQTDEDLRVELFDVNGRLLKTYAGFEKGFNKVQLEADVLLNSGMYFYRIIGEQTYSSGKFIK